jgi:hypothetical protein
MIGIILLIIGAVMFMQFRKAQKTQKRTEAIIWMIVSVFFTVFGLLNLLDSILA